MDFTDLEKRFYQRLAMGAPHNLSEQELRDVFRQLNEWRNIALWLSDVTAATADGFASKKSTSQSELHRQLSIVRHLESAVENETSFGLRLTGQDKKEWVVTRLRGALEDLLKRTKSA